MRIIEFACRNIRDALLPPPQGVDIWQRFIQRIIPLYGKTLAIQGLRNIYGFGVAVAVGKARGPVEGAVACQLRIKSTRASIWLGASTRPQVGMP